MPSQMHIVYLAYWKKCPKLISSLPQYEQDPKNQVVWVVSLYNAQYFNSFPSEMPMDKECDPLFNA
jgi:hypothetical protein